MCSSEEEKIASSEKYSVVEYVESERAGINSSATACCPKTGSDIAHTVSQSLLSLFLTYKKPESARALQCSAVVRHTFVPEMCRTLQYSLLLSDVLAESDSQIMFLHNFKCINSNESSHSSFLLYRHPDASSSYVSAPRFSELWIIAGLSILVKYEPGK